MYLWLSILINTYKHIMCVCLWQRIPHWHFTGEAWPILMMAADWMGNPPRWALEPGYSGYNPTSLRKCSEQCPKASKTLVFVGHPFLLVGRWFSYWIKDDRHSFLLVGQWFSYWIKVISSKLAGINPSSCNQRNHQAFWCILGLFFLSF